MPFQVEVLFMAWLVMLLLAVVDIVGTVTSHWPQPKKTNRSTTRQGNIGLSGILGHGHDIDDDDANSNIASFLDEDHSVVSWSTKGSKVTSVWTETGDKHTTRVL